MSKEFKIVYEFQREDHKIKYNALKEKLDSLKENDILGNVCIAEEYLLDSNIKKNGVDLDKTISVLKSFEIERYDPTSEEETVISKIIFNVSIIGNFLPKQFFEDLEESKQDINDYILVRPCGLGEYNYNGTATFKTINNFDIIVFASKQLKEDYLSEKRQVKLYETYTR